MSKNRSQSGSVQEPSKPASVKPIAKPKRYKRLHVLVTQEEIDNALRTASTKCMIWQAIKRDHPEFEKLWVDKNHIRFTDPKQNVIYTWDMSPLGRVSILLWDSGKTVHPFKLNLYHPVVRERRMRGGHMRPKGQTSAKRDLGPIPQPKTKEEAALSGRDRVFGAKLWERELAKVRNQLIGSDEELVKSGEEQLTKSDDEQMS